jgi:transposase
MQDITFVGLDVHEATLAVAVAGAGRDGEVRHLGRLENRPEVVRRLVERLRRDGQELRVCYEAGPCGYGLHRQLTEARLPLRGGGAGPDPAPSGRPGQDRPP